MAEYRIDIDKSAQNILDKIYERFGVTAERLVELAKADGEGRVHILPSPRENTCGKCGNFVRVHGCSSGKCTLRPRLTVYQSRVKCKGYAEKEQEGKEDG